MYDETLIANVLNTLSKKIAAGLSMESLPETMGLPGGL